MRLANIIITHKNPQQLERLIKKMQHPNFDFFIHIDKKVDIKPFEYLKNLPGVSFIQERVVCNWGGYSTLKAMMNSLSAALNSSTEYAFYNLLSGQDYPLKTNDEIYDFLLKHMDKSFIFYETDNAANWWENGVKRFERYHLTDFNFTGKSFVERMINIVLPKRKFPMSMNLYGGSKSSWWTINNESAVYLENFLNGQDGLEKFLKLCWGTDEFVIPTILNNSPFKNNVINNNLRYIDFPKGKANPKILGVEDMGKMIASDMLFARKFDSEVNNEILDVIDEHSKAIG